MRRLDLAAVVVIGAASVALLHAAAPSIAQDTPAVAGESRVGVVDVLALVEQMLQKDEYATVRESMADELTNRIQDIQNELATLSNQLNTMAPGDPQGQDVYNRLQQQRQYAQQFQEQSLTRFQDLSARQASEAYAAVRTAIRAVAAREGYTMVIASREGDDLSDSHTLPAVTQEVLARPVVVGMSRDNLTERVRTELGLPEPSAEPAPAENADEGAADDQGADEPQPTPEPEDGDAP
ncbi:MAG: OmpH family outer membrane protein [Phycisphaerales bacterium]